MIKKAAFLLLGLIALLVMVAAVPFVFAPPEPDNHLTGPGPQLSAVLSCDAMTAWLLAASLLAILCRSMFIRKDNPYRLLYCGWHSSCYKEPARLQVAGI